MMETTKFDDLTNNISAGLNFGKRILTEKGKVIYVTQSNLEFLLQEDFSYADFIGRKEAQKLSQQDFIFTGDFLFGISENGKPAIHEAIFSPEYQYVASPEFLVVNPNSWLKAYLKIPRYRKKIADEIGSVKDIESLIEKLQNYSIDMNATLSPEEELEVEDVDEKPDQEDSTHDPKKLNLSEISMSQKSLALSNILQRMKHNELNMHTKFQRAASLWEEEKKCKLIESILLSFPIPAFYFDASDDENWLIIDGLQRLSSIKEFVLDNSLTLSDLDYLTELNGKTFTELERPFQRKIEEFEIVVYLVLPGTPKQVKYNLFKRINSGALKLEDQEIRHALNQGKPADTLIRFANFNEFKSVIQLSDVRVLRMEDREIVLRYLSFQLSDYRDYTGNIKHLLNKTMEEIESLSDEQIANLEQNFKHSLLICKSIFGKHTFRRSIATKETKVGPFSKVIYEPWIYAVSKLTFDQRNKLVHNKSKIRNIFRGMLNGEHNQLGHDTIHEFDAFEKDRAYTSKRLRERFESIVGIANAWSK